MIFGWEAGYRNQCTMYPLVSMQRAKPSDLKVAFHTFRFEEEFLPYIMCNIMSVCMLDQTPPVAILINYGNWSFIWETDILCHNMCMPCPQGQQCLWPLNVKVYSSEL